MKKLNWHIVIFLSCCTFIFAVLPWYSCAQDYSGLHITELHYHPLDSVTPAGDTIKSKNFEFIELKNRSDKAISMSGCKITGGIRYEFKEDAVILPNQFFILAEDKKMFKATYGFKANGRYKGKLSNKGEIIYILDPAGELIDMVEYSDSYTWTNGSDGDGKSLALVPGADNDHALSWAILKQGVSPKKDNLNFEYVYKLNNLKVSNILGKEMIQLEGTELQDYDLNTISNEWPSGIYIVEVIQNNKHYQDTFVKQ